MLHTDLESKAFLVPSISEETVYLQIFICSNHTEIKQIILIEQNLLGYSSLFWKQNVLRRQDKQEQMIMESN